jgi:1-acyl-sn-glycerol-3-phosphate acyltransferase
MLNEGIKRRNRTWVQVAAEFCLNVFGWKLVGRLPTSQKYVLVGAHHTSKWDFPLGLLTFLALGMPFRWIGKDSLFKRPFGALFRKLGGIPVNRSVRSNFVSQVVELFDQHENLVIAISPEGTRRETKYWRTGFYYIALGARVPIALAFLDYPSRTVGLGPLIWPTGEIENDLEKIRTFYDGVQGRYPERHGLIQVKPKDE